jgi:ubiquitin-like-conjugating enzyme ATG3
MMAQIEDECCGDDWLVSKVISPEEQQRRMDEKLEEEFDILDEDGETLKKVESAKDATVDVENLKTGDEGPDTQDADDEYADMEEFEDDDVMEDEAAVATTAASAQGKNIMKVRTYDLSITYDKYYQTPRVYMLGYASSDSSQPLTGDEMFQDVMSDYANRTVTIDPHPHVAGQYATIHPCQHGAVMKTIVRNLTKASADGEKGKPPSVEMYLFIFLKFISSIVPTIIYDFTMDVTASTEK